MSDKTPEFFTDEFGNSYFLEFGNSYFLVYRNEAGSAYRVVPREGTSPLANAPRSDEERRELVRQFGSIENFGVALLDIVERLNRAVPYGLEDFAVLVDAASEIERLRQEADLKGSRLDDALDEIERLHAEINSLVSAQSGWGRVPKLEAEIERLRAEVARLNTFLHPIGVVINQEVRGE